MEKKSKLISLKGQYNYDEKKKQYIFDALTGSKISCKSLRYIIDPTYDITFNILFGTTGCEYRLIALLNSLLFPGNNEKKITKLEYLTNELKNFDKKWYKNSLRANITCEIEINNNKFILFLEIQKEFNKLKISITSRVNNTKNLEHINTVLINLDKELINITNNEDININNKVLDIEGKEFIKLLGVKIWATKIGEKFVLPNLDLSDNEAINECINILSSINDIDLTEILMDEKYKLDIIKNSENKTLIKIAFQIFLEGINDDRAINLLKDNNVVLEDEDEIREKLFEEHQSLVDEFIEYLKIYEFF